MMKFRTAALGGTAWVVVVALASTLVWSVISRAGQGVTPETTSVVPATTATAPATGSDAPGSPEPSVSPSVSPAPSASGAGSSPVRETWTGAGGVIVAACTASVIRLVGAQPDAGFTVEVKESGPDELEVEFEGQGEEGRDSEVRASCVDGAPRFTTESGSE